MAETLFPFNPEQEFGNLLEPVPEINPLSVAAFITIGFDGVTTVGQSGNLGVQWIETNASIGLKGAASLDIKPNNPLSIAVQDNRLHYPRVYRSSPDLSHMIERLRVKLYPSFFDWTFNKGIVDKVLEVRNSADLVFRRDVANKGAYAGGLNKWREELSIVPTIYPAFALQQDEFARLLALSNLPHDQRHVVVKPVSLANGMGVRFAGDIHQLAEQLVRLEIRQYRLGEPDRTELVDIVDLLLKRVGQGENQERPIKDKFTEKVLEGILGKKKYVVQPYIQSMPYYVGDGVPKTGVSRYSAVLILTKGPDYGVHVFHIGGYIRASMGQVGQLQVVNLRNAEKGQQQAIPTHISSLEEAWTLGKTAHRFAIKIGELFHLLKNNDGTRFIP